MIVEEKKNVAYKSKPPFSVSVIKRDGTGGFTKYFSNERDMEKWVNTCNHGNKLIVTSYGQSY